MKRSIFLSVLVLAALAPVTVQAEAARFPDNHAVRQKLSDIITASTSTVLATPGALYRDANTGTAVRFEVLTQNNDFYLVFANRVNDRYPLDSPGSYIIKRTERDGSFVQVKIFLNGNPDSFVRIFPMGDRSTMDLYLYGYQLYHNVTVPLRFGQILTDSFSKVMALTAPSINWTLVLPVRPLSEDQVVESMVTTIRRLLPQLSPASSAQGSPFTYFKELRDLSHGGFTCTGFGKWIIDGLYEPQTGHLITIESLKKKHLELRGNPWSNRYEKERDPYFGLDWTRNLAVALTRLDNPSAGARADDVTDVPNFSYVDNVGYAINNLEIVLYELAVTNPGYFYLGAVNREYGSNPVLREYTHVVALFPYFDAQGRFRVAVVDRGLEEGVKFLQGRFPNDYIHLVSVQASRDFHPPMPR